MSLSEHLRELQSLVRIGLPIAEMADIQEPQRAEVLRSRILGVLATARKALRPTEIQKLKLVSLATEFQYNFGSPEESAAELEGLVDPIAVQNWDFKERYFEEAQPNQTVLRQHIWALMGVAFYGWYTSGKIDDALWLLKQILKLIEEIDVPPRRPYGTWSRCHYFLAHCYRAKRQFKSAEHHFLESQLYAQKRMRRQQFEIVADRPQEYLFATICCARILGAGLSWVAIQQGQLEKALHMLRTAETLLDATGQAGLKLFITSLIGLTQCRLFPPRHSIWIQGIACLDDCEATFTRLNDRRGRRRCLQELARAFLDAAGTRVIKQDLDEAQKYINRLEQLGGEYLDSSPEMFRSSLLRSRVYLHEHNTSAARLALERARQHMPAVDTAEYGDSNGDLAITEGMIALEEHDFDVSIGALQRALLSIKEGADPVLEAECLLRLALTQASKGDIRSAREQLQRWAEMERFVDNYFLKAVSQAVYAAIAAHEDVPTISFKNLRHKEALLWFKQEITRIALARSGGNVSKAAAMLDLPKASFHRWRSVKRG